MIDPKDLLMALYYSLFGSEDPRSWPCDCPLRPGTGRKDKYGEEIPGEIPENKLCVYCKLQIFAGDQLDIEEDPNS